VFTHVIGVSNIKLLVNLHKVCLILRNLLGVNKTSVLEKHVTETLFQLTVETQFLFSLTVLLKLALNVGIFEPALSMVSRIL